MPTLAELLRGASADAPRETVKLSLLDGSDVDVDVMLIAPLRSLDVLQAARAEAIKRGVAEPDAADPIYTLALQAHTIAACCVTPESRGTTPEPFFASAEQVLDNALLSRDSVAFLFAAYESFVDRRSLGTPRELTPDELRAMIERTAEGDLLFFSRLRPGMQWVFTLSMARLLRAFLADKSRPSSPSDASTPVAATTSRPTDNEPAAD